ncbi:SdrD B-like domain-containing protein [Microlunatus sp. GCM10028923]|uniref:SdrD B-like domain-containing protein n=1 Tax=Microlunatus sp. GCM10028923 TaxID=3273400 RepID=UPI0036130490
MSGTVFRDYNLNGVIDTEGSAENPAIDVGYAGVAVTAYDAAGDEVGTATTAADGTYTLSYDTGDDSTDVRLEFAVPSGFTSTQSGVDGSTSGTSVQFVSAGDTADLGIHAPGDYSAGGDALIITPVERGAIQTNGDAAPGEPTDPNSPALVSTPQNTQESEEPPLTVEATQAQIGTTFGTASLPNATNVNGYVFTSALVKRHSKLGPGGAGAIYLTNIDGDANGEIFASIPNAGDPRPSNDDAGYDWFHDPEVNEEVFTTGLGGLVAAGDGSALYVTNLSDGQIYRVPITSPLGSAPVAGEPESIGSVTDLPGAEQACDADAARPFGLGIDGGTLYAGVTCTGPDTAALRSYVYSYDTVTEQFSEAPVQEFSLDFSRGCGQLPGEGGCTNNSDQPSIFDGGHPQAAAWNPWTDDVWSTGGGRVQYPQPILSDVTVDRTGSLSMTFRDRTGDLVGWNTGTPDEASDDTFGTHVSGDLLKACGNAADGWTLEDNGSCGGQAGAAPNSNRGPGGGEFYDGVFDQQGSGDPTSSVIHQNTWMGGSALVPGFTSIRSAVFDPTSTVFSGGVKRSSISDGSFSAGLKIYERLADGSTPSSEDVGTMGKGNGLGDLTTLAEQGPVEIGNRVWIDTDQDGIQDPGEDPVEGVKVDAECEGGATGTTNTDADGEYYFNDSNVEGGLPSSTECTLTFDTAGTTAEGYDLTEADQGDVDLRDSDGQPADEFATIAATTPAAGADHSFDVGYVPADELCTLGDFVWNDEDGDGVQDEGEPGVPGVTVTLIDPETGEPVEGIDPVTTNDEGQYEFPSIPCGEYIVRFSDIPEGTTYTPPNGGDDDTTDSDPTPDPDDPTVAETEPVVVGEDPEDPADNEDPTIDAGIIVPDGTCAVGDYVFYDSNNNGVQDDGEEPVAQVTVELINAEGEVVATTTTDDQGLYAFDLQVCGDYTVKFSDLPEGYTFTTQETGDDQATDSNPNAEGVTPTFTLGEGEPNNAPSTEDDEYQADVVNPTIDAGIVEVCSIGDYVWNDTDGDGVQDEGEPGVPGVTVTLIDPETGEPVEGIDPVTTDEDGKYEFPSIPCGEYVVRFSDIPEGSEFTEPTQGEDPATDSNPTPTPDDPTVGETEPVTVGEDPEDPADNENPTIDAGIIAPTCAVGDYVWIDANNNGVQDDGEKPVKGVTVELINADGKVVATTTTDDQGLYAFDLQACGDYTVKFSDLPEGYTFTSQESGDGQATDSNPNAEGVTPTFTLGEGEPNNAASTDGDEYQAEVVNPTIDAGLVKPVCTVGDRVWEDTNGNGVQDEGEPGVEGVTVTVIDPETGEPVEGVDPVKTDENGEYSIEVECNEPIQVQFTEVPDEFRVTKPNVGDDDSTDSDPTPSSDDPSVVITEPLRPLPDGDPNVDLGLVPPMTCTIGDYVWYDDDADGMQDEGEDPVPGAKVELINADGEVVETTETDGDGRYLFEGVECGTYQVKFTELPDGYVITKPTAGDRCEDSNPDPSTGLTGEVKLTKDDPKDLCLDAGIYSPSGELPETGSSALLGWGLGGGIALAVIGGALLITRRRKSLSS